MSSVDTSKISIGWWYAHCCEEDLTQIVDDAELECVRESAADDAGLLAGFWATEKAARYALGKVEKIILV